MMHRAHASWLHFFGCECIDWRGKAQRAALAGFRVLALRLESAPGLQHQCRKLHALPAAERLRVDLGMHADTP